MDFLKHKIARPWHAQPMFRIRIQSGSWIRIQEGKKMTHFSCNFLSSKPWIRIRTSIQHNPNICHKKLPYFLSVERVSKMHFLPTAAVAKRHGGQKKHSAAIYFPFKVLLKIKQHM